MSRCTCESDTGYVGPCHDGRPDGMRCLPSTETGKQFQARMRAVQDRLAQEREARDRVAYLATTVRS